MYFFMLSMLAAFATTPEADRTLHVHVVDADGQSNPNADVVVDGNRVSVDERGWAEANVSKGPHDLSVTADDHYAEHRRVRVKGDGAYLVVSQERIDLEETGRVFFKPGSAKLTRKAKLRLLDIADDLKQDSEWRYFRADGFADPTGDVTDNLLLSQARADAVERFLERNGVDPLRLVSVEHGEDVREPVAEAASLEDRRVVVISVASTN